MSLEEKASFIEYLRNRLQAYKGFTQLEKNFAHIHLPEWVGSKGELDLFIQKFSEHFSLDVRPFLSENKFVKQV